MHLTRLPLAPPQSYSKVLERTVSACTKCRENWQTYRLAELPPRMAYPSRRATLLISKDWDWSSSFHGTPDTNDVTRGLSLVPCLAI